MLWRLDRVVSRAASAERVRGERFRPFAFRSIPRPSLPVDVVGDGTISTIALAAGALVSGGGSGLTDGRATWDTRTGLASLRVSAVASWRGQPAFALERGGWGRIQDRQPQEATSGWGLLEVRVLRETQAGELLVGACQGLFSAAFGATELERLDTEPVRAIALLPGGAVAAGGERGLRIVSPAGAVRTVKTPEPWIEAVAYGDGTLWAATPAGIVFGPLGEEEVSLAFHPRGGDGTRGVLVGGRFLFLPVGEPARVAAIGADGSRVEEAAPEPLRRLLAAGGDLYADSASGLYRRESTEGWTLVRRREKDALPLPHVNALAAEPGRLWAGFFDGGIARADLAGPGPAVWQPVAGSDAWGVNALLPAGGVLFAATLRGAFRIEGGRAAPLPGAGGAYSLATTPSGVAVGYGLGVALPGQRLLSAFHGLPGNQAFALTSSRSRGDLWVGTPTGLGRIDGHRVTSRAVPGEGKLPHPWVTALIDLGDSLLVATYGGGLARRRGDGPTETWERFPETAGLKVNAGALVVDGEGRAWIGTEGRGLWRSDPALTSFEPVPLSLPSPDVFSIAPYPPDAPEVLFVGTSEGLAKVPIGRARTSMAMPAGAGDDE